MIKKYTNNEIDICVAKMTRFFFQKKEFGKFFKGEKCFKINVKTFYYFTKYLTEHIFKKRTIFVFQNSKIDECTYTFLLNGTLNANRMMQKFVVSGTVFILYLINLCAFHLRSF